MAVQRSKESKHINNVKINNVEKDFFDYLKCHMSMQVDVYNLPRKNAKYKEKLASSKRRAHEIQCYWNSLSRGCKIKMSSKSSMSRNQQSARSR